MEEENKTISRVEMPDGETYEVEDEYARQQLSSIALMFYPVGSIYMSTINKNPEEIFGGQWERWGAGRVPVGVDIEEEEYSESEKVGGKTTNKYSYVTSGTVEDTVLTVEQMPEHTHEFKADFSLRGSKTNGIDAGTGGENVSLSSSGTSWANGWDYMAHEHKIVKFNIDGDTSSTSINETEAVRNQPHTHQFTGNEQEIEINNLQPYITCYMWKRTA